LVKSQVLIYQKVNPNMLDNMLVNSTIKDI